MMLRNISRSAKPGVQSAESREQNAKHSAFCVLLSALILLLAVLVPISCGKKQEPLRIACSDDMLPVVKILGREFRANFGVPVLATRYEPGESAVAESTNFDFIVTDDLGLVDRLLEDGTISKKTDISCVMPVIVLRREDRLPVLKLADLAVIDRPLRMTIASSGGPLPTIVKSRFQQANIPLRGDEAKIQLLPFLIKEIRSDGTQQPTTPETMLQQLLVRETDMVVFWDFVAARAMANHTDSDAFVTISWPHESADTVTIPLCLDKDCTRFADCTVFIDFVKSQRGSELLQSCFLSPSDDLVGTR